MTVATSKELQKQIHVLEQLLTIREKEIEELRKQILEAVGRLDHQGLLLIALSEHVNQLSKTISSLLQSQGFVLDMLKNMTQEKASPPKDEGVSEVG